MSVAKVVELNAASKTSMEDALRTGVAFLPQPARISRHRWPRRLPGGVPARTEWSDL